MQNRRDVSGRSWTLALFLGAVASACSGPAASRASAAEPENRPPAALPEPAPTLEVAIQPPITEEPAEASTSVPPGPLGAGSDSWSMFHGNAARTGASTAAAIAEPFVRWKAKVGVQSWLNSPLVQEDRVVVPSCGSRHNASDPKDGVYALDLKSGKQLWHAKLDDDANGASIHAGRVFVTSDDGHVHALDLTSGKRIWKAPGKGKVYTNPLVAGDQVIVGDAKGFVRALAVEDGAARWSEQLAGTIRGGVAADSDRIYAVSQAGEAAAFSHDGSELWRVDVERPGWGDGNRMVPIEAYSVPILYKKLVILPFARDTYYDTPGLIALDRDTGKVRWRAKGEGQWGNVRSTPALLDGMLVYSEPYSGDVVGIDAASGEMRFRNTVDACFFPQWASPAAARGVAYVPRFSGMVFAIERDGRVAWKYYLGDSRQAQPRTPAGLETSGCEWDVPVGKPLFSPAAVAPDGTLLVGSAEGWLYALGNK